MLNNQLEQVLLGSSILGGIPISPLDNLGSMIGSDPFQAQRIAAQQQEAMINPFEFQKEQARRTQLYQQMCTPNEEMYGNPRKKVESREFGTMSRARKLINGAVQAVKDAQKDAQD